MSSDGKAGRAVIHANDAAARAGRPSPGRKRGRPKGSGAGPVPALLKKPPLKEQVKKEEARREAYRLKGLASRRYDYDTMREEFINGDEKITLKTVAERYNAPYTLVRRIAAKERWTILRLNAAQKMLRQKRQQHLAKMADEGIAFDGQAGSTAKLGMTLVAGRLAEIAAQFNAAQGNNAVIIQKLKDGQPVTWTELRSVINYKELRELSQAGLAFQQMGRQAFGTDITQIDIQGPDGSVVETVINIGSELGKDDPARLAAMIEAMERAHLIAPLDLLQLPAGGESGTGNVVDAEVVNDEQKAIES